MDPLKKLREDVLDCICGASLAGDKARVEARFRRFASEWEAVEVEWLREPGVGSPQVWREVTSSPSPTQTILVPRKQEQSLLEAAEAALSLLDAKVVYSPEESRTRAALASAIEREREGEDG